VSTHLRLIIILILLLLLIIIIIIDRKLTNPMGKLCCAREHSVQFFFVQFFYTVKLHSLNYSVRGPVMSGKMEQDKVKDELNG
jgi:hypothetical protein